ncbi:MAG: MFS family permease [Lentisphaeria bacterium]
MHIVLLSWLAVNELGVSSSELGWVQAAGLFPSVFLILLAGALADRYDPARVLFTAQMLLFCSYFILGVLLFAGQLNLSLLVIYALSVGVGNALSQPVREKLISNIKLHTVQKRISLLSITQFSMQSVGIAMAALSDTIGLVFVVAIQASLALVSAVTTITLSKAKDEKKVAFVNTFFDVREGFGLIKTSVPLKQLLVLIAFNGYMHMGVFLVLLPILAAHNYGFTAAQFGSLQLVFVVGMISAHLGLLKQSTLEYPGQGALFSLLYTALIGFALMKHPTTWGFYALIYCWGLVAGNSAGRCRLVLQALAPKGMKGRAISIYQAVLFGAAPIGALVTGYVIKYMSTDEILSFMSISSVSLFFFFLVSRSLWSVKQIDVPVERKEIDGDE